MEFIQKDGLPHDISQFVVSRKGRSHTLHLGVHKLTFSIV